MEVIIRLYMSNVIGYTEHSSRTLSDIFHTI